jgi:hypothetical protein
MTTLPNPRLQRTPSATPPSPLSRKPLGDKWRLDLLAIALGVSVVLSAPAVATPSQASHLAGCYSLSLGPWLPHLPEYDSENMSVTLPPRVRFELQRGTDGWAKGRRLVRPGPGAPAGSIEDAWWWVAPNGALVARWTDGFSGLKLTLKQTDNGLHGAVESVWDYHRPTQIREVTALKISCDWNASGEPR